MKNSLPIPTDIGDYIAYDAETGVCTWLKKPSPYASNVKVGASIGTICNQGYLNVKFQGKSYRLHRLIWFIRYGEDPGVLDVDHIDRNRSNNTSFKSTFSIPTTEFSESKRSGYY